MVTKKIAAGKFKATCLRLMDEVQSTREPVIITKNGRPVAKLVPADGMPEDVFGCLRDQVEIVGDILSPVVPLEDWEVLR
jgi:prevent-host-death family protein